MGLSMGGFGAIHTALAYPDLFGKLTALSSALIVHEVSEMKEGQGNPVANYEYYRECFGDPAKVLESENNPETLVKKIKKNGGTLPAGEEPRIPSFPGRRKCPACLRGIRRKPRYGLLEQVCRDLYSETIRINQRGLAKGTVLRLVLSQITGHTIFDIIFIDHCRILRRLSQTKQYFKSKKSPGQCS